MIYSSKVLSYKIFTNGSKYKIKILVLITLFGFKYTKWVPASKTVNKEKMTYVDTYDTYEECEEIIKYNIKHLLDNKKPWIGMKEYSVYSKNDGG